MSHKELSENNSTFQRKKAEKALKTAKKLEAKRMKEGKKYVFINSKTRVLR